MQLKRLLSVVGLSVLVVSAGCAKKKDLPPRGNLIGSAEFSPQLQFQLQSALETDGKVLDLSKQCLQMVERTDGQKVVELSDSACPQSGLVDALNIVATMKVYSEVEPGEQTYLVMGNSTVLDQNTDVAILKNITEDNSSPQYEIESLCQDTQREALSKNCSIEYSDAGTVKKINYKKSRPANLVRRHQIHELYAADEAIRADMEMMRTSLTNKIEQVRSTLDSKIDAVDQRLQSEDKRIDKKLDTAVAALKAEDIRLDGAISKVREDLTKAVNEEVAARKSEDGKLVSSITELKSHLDLFKNETGENFKKGAMKLSEISTGLEKLGEDLRKSDKEISQSIDALKKELTRIDTLENSSKEYKDAIADIKKQIGRLEALENQDKIIQGMIEDLKKSIEKLKPAPADAEKPADTEKPEDANQPENEAKP